MCAVYNDRTTRELQTWTDLHGRSHVEARFIQNTSLFSFLFSFFLFSLSLSITRFRSVSREKNARVEDRIAMTGRWKRGPDCGFAFFMRLRLRVGGEQAVVSGARHAIGKRP